MPNWKTYESSTRLLSAVIAAHPELKLNYSDIAGYYGDCTGAAVDHRFRPMKRMAAEMRATSPGNYETIADKYERASAEPTTAKAITHRFAKLRADPEWSFMTSVSERAASPGGALSTPKKLSKGTTAAARKRAPTKAKGAASKEKRVRAEDDNEEMGEEEDEDEDVTFSSQYATPKKENLRKVSTGRVNKGGAKGVSKAGARSARGKAQQPDYVEENDDDESNVSVYNEEDGQDYVSSGHGGKKGGYGEEEDDDDEEEEDAFVDAEGGN